MFLVKLLANFIPAMIVVGLFYSLFYFRVVPRLIAHYRKVMTRDRAYEKEITEIQDEGEK